MDHSDQYFKKYLKYKEKYRLLKESIGGNRYDRFGRQEQNMQSQKKMSSKELFRHDFEKWKVTYPQDYKRWLNKLRTTNPSRYLELMNGNMQDPSDSMLSPGTLIYQRTQKRNVQVKQIDPQYSETLWRTKVEHLDPNSDFEEIRRAY